MKNIRRAKEDEAEILTDLAIKSEGYWGYDADYMERFKAIYKVTEEFIKNNPTFVIKEDNIIIGFYGLLIGKEKTELEYLFIEPNYIGKGYGKILWNHMISICKELGIKELIIVTSPQAKDFYVKMGAVYKGDVESLVNKDRLIPQFIYVIS